MKPLLRGHFHQAMFFITFGACLTFFFQCKTHKEMLAVGIYTACALAMFGISAIYHRVTWSSDKRVLWKKFDHCGIYLMIAGTFTPIAMLGLSEASATKLLTTIWSVAVVGIVQSIYFVHLPKMVSAILYLIAGYLILPYISELKDSIGVLNIWLIIAGGLVYSLGAISYGLKRPVLTPSVFSYHEVFHILVNIGAILHFIVINSLIKN